MLSMYNLADDDAGLPQLTSHTSEYDIGVANDVVVKHGHQRFEATEVAGRH